MSSLTRMLFVALAAIAFATVALIGSPARDASAQEAFGVSVDKVCGEGVTGSFDMFFDVDSALLTVEVRIRILDDGQEVQDQETTFEVDVSDLFDEPFTLDCDGNQVFNVFEEGIMDDLLDPMLPSFAFGDIDVEVDHIGEQSLSGILDDFEENDGISLTANVFEVPVNGIVTTHENCSGIDLLALVDSLHTCTITNELPEEEAPPEEEEPAEEEPEAQAPVITVQDLIDIINQLLVAIGIDNDVINQVINALEAEFDLEQELDNENINEIISELVNKLELELDLELDNENINDLVNDILNENENEVDNEVLNQLMSVIESAVRNALENKVDVENEVENNVENKVENKLNNEIDNKNLSDNVNNNSNTQNQNQESNQDQANDQAVNVATGDVNIGDNGDDN